MQDIGAAWNEPSIDPCEVEVGAIERLQRRARTLEKWTTADVERGVENTRRRTKSLERDEEGPKDASSIFNGLYPRGPVDMKRASEA